MGVTPAQGLRRGAAAWILAAEGFASLSVEVLALRRMVPYVGSPVPVTSILLAAYLAALAWGYHRGQRSARRLAAATPPPELPGALRCAAANRLATAAVASAIATGDIAPAVVFGIAGSWTTAAVAVYSTLCIAPIGMLLAESILLIDPLRRGDDGRRQTGTTLGLSTAGNVAGALLTAWVVLAAVGTAGATALTALVLSAAAWTASPKALPIGAAAFMAVLLGAYWANDQRLYLARTAYADYELLEVPAEQARVLSVNRSSSSRDDARGRGHAYIEAVETALCRRGIREVAVLGAAGRTLGRDAGCLLRPTFVDIDPAQATLSKRLLFGPPAGPLVVADARAWLRAQKRRWPAIVADAYSHRTSLPTHLATIEFYRTVRDTLVDGGTAIFNVISLPRQQAFRTRTDRSIRAVFADCETLSVAVLADGAAAWAADDDEQTDNVLYRCVRGDLDGDRTIYSDRLQRIDNDRGLR
jgi:spermidine synthase